MLSPTEYQNLGTSLISADDKITLKQWFITAPSKEEVWSYITENCMAELVKETLNPADDDFVDKFLNIVKNTLSYGPISSIMSVFASLNSKGLIPKGIPDTTNYLTFTAVDAGSVQLKWNNTGYSAPSIDMEVSINDGEWRPYEITGDTGEIITLSANDTVKFRGNNETLGNLLKKEKLEDNIEVYYPIAYWTFIFNGIYPGVNPNDKNILTGTIEASGNIMSLLDKTMQRTDVPEGAFAGMFMYSLSLTTAPELPATTLAKSCYMGMFMFSAITTAPELPATELAESCYFNMFISSAITTAPELPATTLAKSCYMGMFESCESLTTAPELPAVTLVPGCYMEMFANCVNLTSLTVHADVQTDESSHICLADWLENTAVDTYGILHYDGESDYTLFLPKNWYVNEVTPMTNPLTFTSKSQNNDIHLEWFLATGEVETPLINLEVSVNDGEYREYQITDGVGETITLNENDTVKFRGNNESLGNVYGISSSDGGVGFWHFIMTETTEASGNVMSLLNKEIVIKEVPDCAFLSLFQGCASLTTAPELPALYLSDRCYTSMFENTKVSAMTLPADTLAEWCYARMFKGSKLLTLTIHANDISAANCLNDWLENTADGTTGILYSLGSADFTDNENIPANWTVSTNPIE